MHQKFPPFFFKISIFLYLSASWYQFFDIWPFFFVGVLVVCGRGAPGASSYLRNAPCVPAAAVHVRFSHRNKKTKKKNQKKEEKGGGL